ncbi:MAG TPA: hypothetical protein VHE60_03080 [Pyrinomonadaceae bacterium]|nr:hypothetical protein [Pyrinomonadaceae bacterium]
MASQNKLRDIKGIRGALYRLGELRTRTAFAVDGIVNFLRLLFHRNGSRPSITAVVVGRNDDYMSDFALRLRATIAWNMKYLADEVIFVEWNPPPDRELLSIDLVKQFKQLRAYVVPPEIHHAICENSKVQLLEFHAKNVGIRRSNSEWIVTTNADAAFGPDLVNRILATELSEDVVFSAQRLDIPWREGRESQIGALDCLHYRRVIPYHPLGTGEFGFASKQMWERARGYDESLVRHRIGVDKRGVAQLIAHGARSERAGIVFHLAHPTSCTEGVQEHHGELANWDDDVPYENDQNWGLADRQEAEIAERVWLLK